MSEQIPPSVARSPESMSTRSPDQPDLVVGIGASAGGLEALTQFFDNVPGDTGMAFVVIQHLAADQKSHMAELLGRRAPIPVEFATEGMKLERDRVVVMPSDKHLAIEDGRLRLLERSSSGEFRDNLPIDSFLHSLAIDQRHTCVAVILSGTGSDGSRGIRAVKEAGGLVIVQDEKSAKFDGMPRSASATGLADVVIDPSEMSAYLVSYAQQSQPMVKERLFNDQERLERILDFLAEETGVDFNLYKRSTVVRRIQRRMAVAQVSTLEQYDALVHQSPREAERLRDDLLIHVTSFFRDGPAWKAFSERIPDLVAECDPREGLRIWVTACSTGEEAYTVAIALEQAFERLGTRVPYKVFASDVDASAVDQASAGSFSSGIAGDLPPDVLGRWFVKTGSRYTVAREIRERIIFAQHNLISDPPFAKMDVITCRNLLIYLSPEVQQRVLGILQFALRQGGLLMLGSSESLAQQIDAFDTIDAKWKLFKSRQRSLRLLGDVLSADPISRRDAPNHDRGRRDPQSQFISSLQGELIRASLPPTIVVDRSRSIVQTYGDVNEFLRIPGGEPTLDVVKMAEGELSMLLATAIRRVVLDGEELLFDNVAYSRSKEGRARVAVRRLASSAMARPLAAIQIEKTVELDGADPNLDLDSASRARVGDLERELQYTRESLQATVEELETTNEELQASNEELISSNEELQSTNEELQSVNEELHTMNGEFQAKIEELTLANDDFTNLMQTTSVGAIFLDEDLRVRRFTDAALEIIGLVPADTGRRVDDFSWRVRGRDISAAARDVLTTGEEQRFAVHDSEESWYWMRIRPYAAIDSHANGVVITSVDITEDHRTERHYSDLASLSLGIALPIVIVDVGGAIQYANRAFGEATGFESRVAIDQRVTDIVDAEIGERIKTSIVERREWIGLATCARADRSAFWATIRISPVDDEQEDPRLAVISFEEIRSAPPEEAN